MMIDITNCRLDEVSGIAKAMEKFGFSSKIERNDAHLMLILDQKRPHPLEPITPGIPSILSW
ncbi:Uncharacterised protein [uncultured archaeon]|nr:Uncharacterised protein [uncultured archaeon]